MNEIHNAMGTISFSNLADYQTNLLTGLIDDAKYYSLGDSRRALPIRYLKQQESGNEDDETGLKHKQFNSIYYEYHLVPVIENQMLSPQVIIDETKQGMNSTSVGEMVIMTIDKPLVNDLFDFYLESHRGADGQKEIFRITEVNFLRTSADLNIYRLTYETSNVSPKNIYIKRSYFYYNDFRRFFPSKYINFMKLLNKKEYLLTLEKYYKPEWSIIYDETLTKEVNLKLNKVLAFVKYKDPSNSTNIPLILINGYDPSKTISPLLVDDDDDGLSFVKEDVWYPNPDYIENPDIEWNWLNDKIKNELAYTVWEIIHFYKPFIIDNLDLDMDPEDINENVFNDVNLNEKAYSLKEESNQALIDMSMFEYYIEPVEEEIIE